MNTTNNQSQNSDGPYDINKYFKMEKNKTKEEFTDEEFTDSELECINELDKLQDTANRVYSSEKFNDLGGSLKEEEGSDDCCSDNCCSDNCCSDDICNDCRSNDLDNSNDSDISCYLAFHLTNDDDLVFDAAWSSRADLPKLAKIIYIIQNSDFIMENIKEMETENMEDVEDLQRMIEELNDRPVIYPSDVYREDSN